MKKLLSIALIAMGSLTISSCSKDKRADFTLDKTTYTQGDFILTTNTTVKSSKFYRWNFGGTEVYGEEPIFEIPKDQAPGEFVISCEATNSKNSSSSGRSSSQTVMIKEAALGKLIFWNPGNGSASIAIRLFGNNISNIRDTIRYSDSSNPNCNFTSSNAVFQNLKSGEYSYEAVDLNGSSLESGSITLIDGYDCKSVQIF